MRTYVRKKMGQWNGWKRYIYEIAKEKINEIFKEIQKIEKGFEF